MTDQIELISAKEAAKLLGFALNTFYRLLESGKVPGAKKFGRTWRINKAVLLEGLE